MIVKWILIGWIAFSAAYTVSRVGKPKDVPANAAALGVIECILAIILILIAWPS